jgi:hypothetical protein
LDRHERHTHSERLHGGLQFAPVVGHRIWRTGDDGESRRRRQNLFEQLDDTLTVPRVVAFQARATFRNSVSLPPPEPPTKVEGCFMISNAMA